MAATKKKLAELGLELMREGESAKRAFLETNTTLNQTEAAAVLGCRPRDVQKILTPDYYLNTHPKYKIESVKRKQDELIKQSAKIFNTNNS